MKAKTVRLLFSGNQETRKPGNGNGVRPVGIFLPAHFRKDIYIDY